MLATACASSGARGHPFNVHEQQEAFYLPFDRPSVTGFYGMDGKPCVAAKSGVLWEAEQTDATCSHDTLYDGIHDAELMLRWKGVIPKDGDFEIETFDNGLRVWVDVASRGGWNSDSSADVTVVLEARSEHCSLTWMDSVAHVASFGPEVRDRHYGGFREVPTLRLVSCKAGDPLEVRVGLVAKANRGRIEVDSFGFRAGNAYDASRVVGLVARKPGEGVSAMQTTCSRVEGGICTHTEIIQTDLHGGARGHPPPTPANIHPH
ncbi:MAG TPA: hypothetical protein VGH20_12380 [Myxococcales bacterium]